MSIKEKTLRVLQHYIDQKCLPYQKLVVVDFEEYSKEEYGSYRRIYSVYARQMPENTPVNFKVYKEDLEPYLKV